MSSQASVALDTTREIRAEDGAKSVMVINKSSNGNYHEKIMLKKTKLNSGVLHGKVVDAN